MPGYSVAHGLGVRGRGPLSTCPEFIPQADGTFILDRFHGLQTAAECLRHITAT